MGCLGKLYHRTLCHQSNTWLLKSQHALGQTLLQYQLCWFLWPVMAIVSRNDQDTQCIAQGLDQGASVPMRIKQIRKLMGERLDQLPLLQECEKSAGAYLLLFQFHQQLQLVHYAASPNSQREYWHGIRDRLDTIGRPLRPLISPLHTLHPSIWLFSRTVQS